MKFASRSPLHCPRGAKLFLLASSLLLAVACPAAPPFPVYTGQDSQPAKEAPPDLKSFAGTWKASLKGEVFAILVMREKDGTLTGTMNNFDVRFDPAGNLTDDTHKDVGDAPLLNVRFQSGALVFVVMEKDAYQPSATWKFVPKSAEEAELTPLPEGQPNAPGNSNVKPIRMFRDHAKP